MKFSSLILAIFFLFGVSVQVNAQERPLSVMTCNECALGRATDISAAASALIREVMESDRSIPKYIIDHAEAVAVFPGDVEREHVLGDFSVGIVSLRDPQTGLFGAPFFVFVYEGTIHHHVREGKDFVLLAMDKASAKGFLTYKFNIATARGGTFGRVVEPNADPVDIQHGFLAYLRERKSIDLWSSFAGNPVYGSKIVYYCKLNECIYGESNLTRFIPISDAVNIRFLEFADTLNQLYSRKGV